MSSTSRSESPQPRASYHTRVWSRVSWSTQCRVAASAASACTLPSQLAAFTITGPRPSERIASRTPSAVLQ
jgi:hypothetical protein